MGFLKRLRGDAEAEQETCPRCHMPAGGNVEECPECGWDLREAYHAPESAPEADRV